MGTNGSDSLEGVALADQNKWRAKVTAKLVDANGQPVSEATVSGVWKKHSGQTICTTDNSGQCSLISDPIGKKHATFIVEQVRHEDLSFRSLPKLNENGNPADRTIKVQSPHDISALQPYRPGSETEAAGTSRPASSNPTPEAVKIPNHDTTLEPDPSDLPAGKPTAEPSVEDSEGKTQTTSTPVAEPTPQNEKQEQETVKDLKPSPATPTEKTAEEHPSETPAPDQAGSATDEPTSEPAQAPTTEPASVPDQDHDPTSDSTSEPDPAQTPTPGITPTMTPTAPASP